MKKIIKLKFENLFGEMNEEQEKMLNAYTINEEYIKVTMDLTVTYGYGVDVLFIMLDKVQSESISNKSRIKELFVKKITGELDQNEIVVGQITDLNETTEEQRENNPKIQNKLADVTFEVGQVGVQASIWKNNGYVNVKLPFEYRYQDDAGYWKSAYNVSLFGSKKSWGELKSAIQMAYMKRIGIYEEELKTRMLVVDKKRNLGCHNCGFCKTTEEPIKSSTGFTEEQYRSFCVNKQEYVDTEYISFLEEMKLKEDEQYIPQGQKDMRAFVKGNRTKKEDFLQANGQACPHHYFNFETNGKWVSASPKPFLYEDEDNIVCLNNNIELDVSKMYEYITVPDDMKEIRADLTNEQAKAYATSYAESKDYTGKDFEDFVNEYVSM